jgi:hypothetical protein
MVDAKSHKRAMYPPVGYCIYCGIDAELTDEHIIPFGLGGREILPEASCKTCANETGRVEHRVLRGMFWPIRLRQKVQSRRPAPDTLKASIVHSTGTKKVIDVAPNDYPDHLIMLNMKQPGILNADQPTPEFQGQILDFSSRRRCRNAAACQKPRSRAVREQVISARRLCPNASENCACLRSGPQRACVFRTVVAGYDFGQI